MYVDSIDRMVVISEVFMKKVLFFATALLMLLSLAACRAPEGFLDEPTEPPRPTEPIAPVQPTEPPAPTEPPTPTEPPVPTPEPHDLTDLVTGVVDYCQELELGNTYHFDLDGNGNCDLVYYGTYDDEASYWNGCSCLRITLDTFPNDPYVFIVSWDAESARVWAIDSDPEDGVVELLCSDSIDEGLSSCILIPQGMSNGFRAVNAHGGFIDAEHPFSSEEGFAVAFWTQLFGTNFLEGRMKFSWYEDENDYVVRSCEYYTYGEFMFEDSYELKLAITGNLVNEDGSVGEEITLGVGDKVLPYATDNESFIDLKTEDGRIVRFSVEIAGWASDPDDPDFVIDTWYIAGYPQDTVADMRYSG